MDQDALPTPKQLAFEESLAARTGEAPPAAIIKSRKRLAAWIGGKRLTHKMNNTAEPAENATSGALRTQAMERAVMALLECDANDQESLMVAGLQRLWGDGPTDTFLETQLLDDAEWWAISASPLMLSVYLKAIKRALTDANTGRIAGKIL